jgi:hypothetical protein
LLEWLIRFVQSPRNVLEHDLPAGLALQKSQEGEVALRVPANLRLRAGRGPILSGMKEA